ncbi:50S ribosomal protein L35 [Patescibacteria group bacterium]|nr:50S ribosomal protein L35 [Patescibacteria group bacterium]MBU1755109.1 50S ribosomal protein L35 [Patescibacteria group bacterium]
MKTNKSYSKRIRITKNGKLMARHPGQNHYNGLESGGEKRNKAGEQIMNVTSRIRRRFLSY